MDQQMKVILLLQSIVPAIMTQQVDALNLTSLQEIKN